MAPLSFSRAQCRYPWGRPPIVGAIFRPCRPRTRESDTDIIFSGKKKKSQPRFSLTLSSRFVHVCEQRQGQMSAPNKLLRSPSQAVRLSTVGRLRSLLSGPLSQGNAGPSTAPLCPIAKPLTTLQDANPRNMPEVWFNPAFPLSNPSHSHRPSGQPPDDNKVKLGKSKLE